ncbi:hypothetical protein AXF42_Ash013597 [Apostasia shenzhenica]|uniref:DUF1995 domain-containing protein n=1 Tax=Apostasia shenzhenica TaxID=1088818 RepID=A0A2I0APC8_9ASPA|nr:hypothetical protein AXF42_Ash013597 [Apostasia shenzhenica]
MASTPLHLFPNPFSKPLVTQTLPSPLLLKTISCSLSSSPVSPPSTREEAISQARSCLSSTLQKPLNNPLHVPSPNLKKQRQPRYRVEVPIAADDASSLVSLSADLFSGMPLTKKGSSSTPIFLLLWPSPDLSDLACRSFISDSSVLHSDVGSASDQLLRSADLAAFLAPEASMLEEIRMLSSRLIPKPVVLFNPNWGFEEEKRFGSDLGRFVGSFDVVYSFMGLEVRGMLSRRRGVVFRWARDGVMSGEGWVVMVEAEEGKKKGKMVVVSRFKRRPAIGEVENVLYNLMAANSPVTKSVKLLRDWASNITGKKERL